MRRAERRQQPSCSACQPAASIMRRMPSRWPTCARKPKSRAAASTSTGPRAAFGFDDVDLEPHRLAGRRAGRRDVVRRHALGMRDEIGELLAPAREARRDRGLGGIIDIDVRPVGERIEPRRLAGERRAHDGVDVELGLPPGSVDRGEPQRAEVERHLAATARAARSPSRPWSSHRSSAGRIG